MLTNNIRRDPFFNRDARFNSEAERIEREFNNFWHPFDRPYSNVMFPSIHPPHDDAGGRMERYGRHLDAMPFGRARSHGDMFRNAEDMFRDAQRQWTTLSPTHSYTVSPTYEQNYTVSPTYGHSYTASPTHSQSYTSSKIYTYSNDGVNEPKRYEACRETTQGPGGVRQTLSRERNSVTGTDRMQAGHYIYDRGELVEKTHDTRNNDVRVNTDYYNMDSDESEAFRHEWNNKVPAHCYWAKYNGLDYDRRLLKWQHGFSKNYDGSDLKTRRMITR